MMRSPIRLGLSVSKDSAAAPGRISRRLLLTGAAGLGLARYGWGEVRPASGSGAAAPVKHIAPAFQVDNHLPPAWQARSGLTNAGYVAVFDELVPQGYRLLDGSAYFVNGEERYTGIWEASPGPAWVARHGLTSDDHQLAFNEFTGQGFAPTFICGYNAGGTARFMSLYEQRPHGGFTAQHGISGDEFQALFDTMWPQGFTPIDVSAYVIDGQARYTVIWEQGLTGGWQMTHGMLAPDVIATDAANAAQRLRPDRLSGFELNGQTYYAVIWRDRSQMTVNWAYEIPPDLHQGHFEEMTGRGFRQVKGNGFAAASTGARFTTVWHKPYLSSPDEDRVAARVQAVMSTNNLPGFSVAFAKDGRLVYARGFGAANQQTGEAVAPNHLFRGASIAKPITAVMIFRLIETGQLALTDTVFGQNGWLGLDFGTPPANSNIDQVTIQHLLEHTSGWAFGRNEDPMFLFPELDRAGIIRRLVEQVAPRTTPGATHEYENTNYLMLGRVIEEITGLGYEAAVQQQVLGPAGITNMHIAGDTLAERRPDEVVYASQGFDPYALLIDRMDAHGGWIASASDLLRFVGSIDGSPNRPQIINAGTRATM
ncbi:MAG: serine hydrolase, partial [Chloroflexota bacterium]|nr:serine hydrolase [Chloroflexota bacterium]